MDKLYSSLYCSSKQKGVCVTLAVYGQVNSVGVFNPTATTLGISVPYHL